MASRASSPTESSSWLTKTAITWNNEEVPKQGENVNYWNQEILRKISSLPITSFNQEKLQNYDSGGRGENIGGDLNYPDLDSSISYESLLIVTLLVVDTLRQMMSSLIDSSPMNDKVMKEKCGLGIPIAVAIPEGPFLPLAILATHFLGKPITVQETDTSQSLYAILVPMEPTEGKDRLKHMLGDSQPAIVLCMPGQDMDRIKQQISSTNVESSAIRFLDDDSLCRGINLGQTSVVDFSQLILDVIQQYRTDGTETASTSNAWSRLRSYCVDRTSAYQADFVNDLSACLQLFHDDGQHQAIQDDHIEQNRISHIVYTSGTTGLPKGCISSMQSLEHYVRVKNEAHNISAESVVLLASALSFDPCLSDVLATLSVKATLVVVPRKQLVQDLSNILLSLDVSHILCTPTLWSIVHGAGMVPSDFPLLRVVALGGEPIPKRMVHTWARDRIKEHCRDTESQLRMFATYGVTEACVYQTCGEVFRENLSEDIIGQDVGLPLSGLVVEIVPEPCMEGKEKTSNMQVQNSVVGEVVLHGAQLDVYSTYLNRPDLTMDKFVKRQVQLNNGSQNEQDLQTQTLYCYRTGDRGYIHKETNHLHILGRIQGEDGMVKINGVRIELGEIESAIRHDHGEQDPIYCVVTDCLASVSSVDPKDLGSPKKIQAYCVLSSSCLRDLNLFYDSSESSAPLGVLCTSSPLLELLRGRCMQRLKPGCTPSTFVIIQRLPLSPTGKCDRRKLPHIKECIPLDVLQKSSGNGKTLTEYGLSGCLVAEIITDCLNLQTCQKSMLTTSSSFAMLGGDSLTATRVVRALYAAHNGVLDSRKLGGSFGVLEGPFAVSRLILAKSLGDYVDMLDNNSVCKNTQEEPQEVESGRKRHTAHDENDGGGADNQITSKEPEHISPIYNINNSYEDNDQQHSNRLYEALVEAITLRYSTIAMALLDLGADPNFGNHGGRLSKADRRVRKRQFSSNPLHLACGSGDNVLTKKLIEKGCKFTSPDAAGSYPMLLACSGVNGTSDGGAAGSKSERQTIATIRQEEDIKRKECVRSLLDAGAPLAMKDGNKQTVLHCAARSGHCELLKFLMKEWKEAGDRKEIHIYKQIHKGGRFDWADRWFRTPVHWAVLNGNVESLKILLKSGCSANPPKPKTGGSKRQTSLVIESPLEICNRLYGEIDGIGKEMSTILQEFTL